MSNLEFGWVKLHRKVQKNWIYDNGQPFDDFHAWADLIFSANYEDIKKKIGTDIITIHPGQLQTSVQHLAVKWHWSRSKVFRFLKTLEAERMIYTKRNKNGTTLTIANYGLYQDLRNTERNTDDTDGDTYGDTSFETLTIPNVRNTTYKKVKEIKEDKKRSGDFSENKPPKIGDIRFGQYDQYGNEWWERCVKIDPDGYVHWKGCWKWELKEFQEGKL